jgi:ketosteroid isomerase-like protein
VSSNLDLVKSIFDNWGRGDFSSVNWADSEIELVVADGPSPGSWSGLDELGRAWAEVLNAYDEFSATAEEYRELDDGRILVAVTNRGRGRASGVEVAAMGGGGANIFEIRGGRVIRLTTYWNLDRALEDLELAPGPDVAS